MTSEISHALEMSFLDMLCLYSTQHKNMLPAAMDGGAFSETIECSSAFFTIYLQVFTMSGLFSLEQ